MRPSIRNRALFVEHRRLGVADEAIARKEGVQNLVFHTDNLDLKWIEDATEQIGDWRALSRSVFMRWAITINALHLAKDRYSSSPAIGLVIHTLRPGRRGVDRVPLATWQGEEAARNHDASIPLVAAHAVQDMYGALEEIIFALYETFLESHPETILRGDEYRGLRAAFRNRGSGAEAEEIWKGLWGQRLQSWHRKHLHDGLHKVFVAMYSAAGLKRPSWFKNTDVADWARTIETVAEIRNLATHGEGVVSARLGELCSVQPNLGMNFVAGERLEITLHDLWIVENFIDSLLTAINMSLIERGTGNPIPRPGIAAASTRFDSA